MTNREAYMSDLDDLQKAIDCLLSWFPLARQSMRSRCASRQRTRLELLGPLLAA